MSEAAVQTAEEMPNLGVTEIMKMIPHRYPMLLVDRVVKMRRFESAVGLKNVTINEHFFQGHFPNHPIMPGVMIVEAMAQTAGALIVASLGQEAQGKLVYFMTIDEARFRKPVTPGDCLELHVRKLRDRRNIYKFSGEAKVGEQIHAECVFSAMIVDSDS
jgi:3-hydroxyacyl-[acyl-carrier-protein] dehydratase